MTQQTELSAELAQYGRDALAAWTAAAGRIRPQDLDRPTPCAEFSIAGLVDHVRGSMLLLGASAGRPLEAPSDLSPQEQTRALADAAIAAWAERGTDGEAPVGRRTLPAGQVYAIVLMELAVHSWDLERALGTPAGRPDLPAPLVEHLIAQAQLLITPERRGKGFADPVAVGTHARPLDRLVGFTGRTP